MIFRRRRTRIEIAHTAVRLTGGGEWAVDPYPAHPLRPSPPPAPLRSLLSPAETAADIVRAEQLGTKSGGSPFDTKFHAPADKEK